MNNNLLRLDLLTKEELLPIVKEIINKTFNLNLNSISNNREDMFPDLVQDFDSKNASIICDVYDGSYTNEDLYHMVGNRLPMFKEHFPIRSYLIVVLSNIDQFVLDKIKNFQEEYGINISTYDLQRMQELILKFPHLVEKVRIILGNNIESLFDSDDPLPYLADQIWKSVGDKYENFINGGFWEIEPSAYFNEYLINTNVNDLIFLKSNKDENVVISAVGKVLNNPRDGIKLEVNWIIKNLNISIHGNDQYKSPYAKLKISDEKIILEKIEIDNLKRLKNQNPQIAIIDPDTHNGPDHLDIEKDVSAFARIISSKKLKPPLAIALFGEWGSGKSFFMEKLISKINAFTNPKSEEQRNIYCEGIVQIRFNAWSYMDANLWASLVSNIYEKLDEYISKQTKGDSAKEKVKSILNQELSVVNEEREKAIEAQKQLIATEKNLCLEKENLEKEKDKLLSETFKKEIDKAYLDINKKLNFDNTLKKQLKLYGIDEARLNELAKLSPDHVIQEIKSWYYFIKNLLHFNWWQIVIIVVCAVLLIVVNCNIPLVNHLVSGHITRAIISFFSIAGPVFVKFFNSAKVYIDSYEKVKRYKDELDNKLKEISMSHALQIKVIEDKLSENNDKLVQKVTEIHKLDREIQTISHNLQYSVTQKAFLDFIKTKSSDEKYDKALSIISTIRKDFETLSELFHEYNIPPNLSDEEREVVKNKKAMIDSFKDQFKRPLDRIVLYVDDLDRCSEERVIEVLEAVNLLMAYPLFVVVVGVDKRWVKNALYKKYELHFLKSLKEDTSKYEMILPEDYLEKIFQIPFQLQNASDEEVKSMIRKQLEPHLESDFDSDDFDLEDFGGGSEGFPEGKGTIDPKENRGFRTVDPLDNIEYLSISEEHVKLMECFSGLIGANPRAIKRFINLYQIISAHDDFRALANKQEESHAIVMLFLAIFNGRYKDRSENIIKPEFGGLLKDFLDSKNHECFSSLVKIFKTNNQFEKYLNLEMSTCKEHWDLVRRFTFVSVSEKIEE